MKEIVCPNCGATFDASLPKCPYCDFINPEGAEDEFFDNLEGTRENLKTLVNAPEAGGSYTDEIKKSTSGVAKKAVIVAVVIVLLILIGVGIDRMLFNYDRDAGDYSKELAWQNDHFSEFDELYTAEKYDEIIKLFDKYENEGHTMYNWTHYEFIMSIDRFNDLQDHIDKMDQTDVDKSFASVVLYDTFYLVYKDYESNVKDEKDLAILSELSDKARVIATTRLGFTNSELDELEQEVRADGYVEFRACEKVAAKQYKKFK